MATETISAPRENLVPRNGRILPGAIIGRAEGLVLRYARDEDAAAIISLVAAVWGEYPDKTLVAESDMPELLKPATFYGRCQGRFWVVEANDEIIGTIALAPSPEPGVVELQKLYVARGVRRNGLGSFLCHLVEREARERGAHAVELWSDVKLLDAHHRYERLGYHRGTELKAYADTSSTVRYYYRKELEPQPAGDAVRPLGGGEGWPDGLQHWQTLFHLDAASGTTLGIDQP